MYVTLNGKRWKLRFTRLKNDWGDCDPPEQPGKEIRICTSAQGEKELETLIHEGLHAYYWDLGEEFVARAATDLGRMLWRLGYRKQN